MTEEEEYDIDEAIERILQTIGESSDFELDEIVDLVAGLVDFKLSREMKHYIKREYISHV